MSLKTLLRPNDADQTLVGHLRRSLSLLDRRSAFQFSLVALLIIISAALEAIGIGLVFPLIQVMSDPSSVKIPSGWQNTVSFAGDDPRQVLLAGALAFLAVIVFKNIVLVAVIYLQFRVVFENEWRLSERLFATYLRGPYLNVMERNSAELIRNAGEAVSETFKGVILGLITLATEACVVLAIVAILFVADLMAGIAASATLCLGGFLYHYAFRRRFAEWGEQSLGLQKDVLKSLQQGLQSLKIARVLGRESFFLDMYSQAKKSVFHLAVIHNTAHQTPRIWIETMVVIAFVVVVAILLGRGYSGTDVVPLLGLFAAAAFRLTPSINRLLVALNGINRGASSLNVVYGDFQIADATARKPDDSSIISPHHSEAICLKNVSFRYPSATKDTLRNINFSISRGKTVGLVGPSGAGKTTFVDVILGLLAPSEGQAFVFGADINIAPPSWRRHIGYVPQSVYILDDTLKRNIAFGVPNSEIDEAMVERAVQMSRLSDLVESLPLGLETGLGEHGFRFSGGQIQRVGIARALYHNPEIVVFDEATSALDPETEREITLTLESLRGALTLIVIAHRLSTVRNCDRIAFMCDGQIVDNAPFEDILRRNAAFARMVELAQL